MLVLKAFYSFVFSNLLLIVVTFGVVGVLFGPDFKSFFEKLMNRKTCPHCGGRMELTERNGKTYWSCTKCQVNLKAKSENA